MASIIVQFGIVYDQPSTSRGAFVVEFHEATLCAEARRILSWYKFLKSQCPSTLTHHILVIIKEREQKNTK
jgi:hypothetical protein